ncbi:MAG: glutathione S-transferase family protein [Leptolyngbyaceae bacterium]|nr:glutathione S-transferase family protein [Leptolyngbyaceae bacterium]
MTQLTLIIGNKNYSSWSLRPWLLMKQWDLDFTEVRIPLYTPVASSEILRYSPAGKVPILHHGLLRVWDSLAICEYLAEQFPDRYGWPQDFQARAIARSISAEMHSGFQALRQNMPMNCRSRFPGKGMTASVQTDIDRVTSIWRDCRQTYGKAGDLLFGELTIADAMFAPVVTRFITYGVSVDPISSAYMEAILALPAMQTWLEAAQVESETISAYEP